MKQSKCLTASVAIFSLVLLSGSAFANPGNGNGNHGNGHGNSANHGNSDHRKSGGKPDHVDSDISVNDARNIALSLGLTGYKPLPPGIAKNLARGKPLPPGIAKKGVPSSMLNQLPYYPGYEWRSIGDDLVLIALSTAIVTTVLTGVFH